MSFLIKGILKTLLKQYLNIVDDISMEKGFIQLPSGHLNHQNINNNKHLSDAGITILNSQYTGLAISIPLMEILAKPIVFRAERLRAIIEVDDHKRKQKGSHPRQKNARDGIIDQQGQSNRMIVEKEELNNSKGKKQEGSKNESKQINDSYIKGLVNRLLANMEIQLKELQILVIHKQKHGTIHSYRVEIKNFMLKNSLSLLEANLLKKIVSLGSIELERLKDTVLIGEEFFKGRNLKGSQELMLSVQDLNMSLNIDYKKINAIVLIDTIRIKIQDKMVLELVDKFLEAQHDRIHLLNEKRKAQNEKQRREAVEEIQEIEIAAPKTRISIESLQLKIHTIELILTSQEHNTSYQLYTLKASSVELLKQMSSLNTIHLKNKIQMMIQSQKISLSRRNYQIMSVVVNKLNEDNITDRLKNDNGEDKQRSSKKLISDYDRVIKNKKRQFMIRVGWNRHSFRPVIEIDSLAYSLNIKHSFIEDLTILVDTLCPKLDLYLFTANKIQQIKKSIKTNIESTSSLSSGSYLFQENQQQLAQFNACIMTQNIAITTNLFVSKEEIISGCVLSPNLIDIKVYQEEISVSIPEKIVMYLNQLQMVTVREIYASKKREEIIASIDSIVLRSDISLMMGCAAKGHKFIVENENFEYLLNRFKKIEISTLETEQILKQLEEDQKNLVAKPSPKIYFRTNKFEASLGSLNKSNVYLPIFILQVTEIKSFISKKVKTAQLSLCSLSCISPHNLSCSQILNQQSGKIKILGEHHSDNSTKLQVKNSVNLDIKQQEICLLLNLLDSFKVNKESKHQNFVRVTNKTNSSIKIREFQEFKEQKQIKPQKSFEKSENFFASHKIYRPQIPKEYQVLELSDTQIILSSQLVQFMINAELSQPIDLNSSALQMPILFSYQEDCLYVVEVSSQSTGLQISIKYRYELFVFEGISQQLNHIHRMQIKTDRPQDQIIYQRYLGREEELFCVEKQIQIKMEEQGQEISQYDSGMRKQLKMQNNKQQKLGHQYNNMISFGWELLQDDKLDTLSFYIHSDLPNHPKFLKISKLISNNVHYKVYGLYSPKIDTQTQSEDAKYNYFYYYILEEMSDSINTVTHKYYLMPLLIFQNHLDQYDIRLKVISKKLNNSEEYNLKKNESKVAFGGKFDFYMKQYMIRIQMEERMLLEPQKGKQKQEEVVVFESQQHYFNTFFMVEESFESPIQLRSQDNRKRYLRVKESFIKKTKIMEIENTLTLVNNTEIPLSLSLMFRSSISPTHSQKTLKELPLLLKPDSQQKMAQKLKKGDTLSFVYDSGTSESKIDVPISSLEESDRKLVLCFNFCRFSTSQIHENYSQIILKLQFKQNNSNQTIIISPFITFTNLCRQNQKIVLNNCELLNVEKKANCRSSFTLNLPSNTNKDYNNRWMPVNIQKIYEDLFMKPQNWIIEGDSDMMQIDIREMKEEEKEEQEKKHKGVKFSEILNKKMVEINNEVYSLIKSMKDEKIEFYFSDRLFNTNIQNARYYIINNETHQNFLMSSGEQQYAKYIFNPNIEQSSSPTFNQNMPTSQKIYIRAEEESKRSFSILLNKDRYDIFLCDKHKQKLESYSVKKLEKIGIKQEKYSIENFSVLNLERIVPNRAEAQLQILLNNFNVKYTSNKKSIGALLDFKMLNFRILEKGKVDALVKDITFSILQSYKSEPLSPNKNNNNNANTFSIQQILRIPEESYFLLENKILDTKIWLIKNVFIKCKIIDLHVNKHLLSFLVYAQRFARESARFREELGIDEKKKEQMSEKNIDSEYRFEYATNIRILNLVRDKILLIRSIHLHQVNLCLNVQTNSSNNFSNIISLPELTISNRNYKTHNLVKDISNHYLTNIIAKFPKLSFIYQNLRSPIAMVKSLIQAREVIAEKDQKQEKKRYDWSRSYITLNNTYDSSYLLKKTKKVMNNKSVQTKQASRLGLHNETISNYLCKQYLIDHQDINERVLCRIDNVIFNNATRELPVVAESNLEYIMTNKNIYIFLDIPTYSPSTNPLPQIQSPRQNKEKPITQEVISLKQIEQTKILKYNEKNGEMTISLRRKGCMLKIVDSLERCEKIYRLIGNSIV